VSDWITSVIETIGLPGITGLMALEMFIPVIQSEIVMTFSGYTASEGEMNVVLVAAVGIAGSQLGALMLYGIVRPLSEDRVNGFLDRYGGWLGFDLDDLESAQNWFRRRDHWAVFIGRFIPGVRGAIAVPAGVQRMPVWKFFLANLAGTVFWVGLLTYLGWVLGENFDLVDRYSSYITYTFLGLVAAWVLYRVGVVLHRRSTR
jgi:membrane protein DedA with SNARE-associated domain